MERMKQVQVLSLFVCALIGNVLSGSSHDFQDLKDREGVLSFLEYSEAVSSSSSVTDEPLMVGLTLIQGADSKGAGTSFFSLVPVSIWMLVLSDTTVKMI